MPRPRKTVRVLYLGLDLPPPPRPENERWVHHPLIQVVPRPKESIALEILQNHLTDYTHIIFTSKTAVKVFSDLISPKNKISAHVIAVGKSTAQQVRKFGWPRPQIPAEETAEGIQAVLETMDLTNAFVLWPHSALSRTILFDFFQARNIPLHHPVIYDTYPIEPEKYVNLNGFDVVYFTSPSTVDAFFQVYGRPPEHLQFRTIGPVTENYLQSRLAKF